LPGGSSRSRASRVCVPSAPRCLLTREEDYAYAQPSLTRKKLRRLELTAGALKGKVQPGILAANTAMRRAERELARQGELAYRRTVADCRHTRARARHRDAHLKAFKAGSSAPRDQSQTCALARRRPRPSHCCKEPPRSPIRLVLHRSRKAAAVSRCPVAWKSIAPVALLRFGGTKGGVRADRGSADVWSSPL
jgi:hypothetical protein